MQAVFTPLQISLRNFQFILAQPLCLHAAIQGLTGVVSTQLIQFYFSCHLL